MSVTGVVVTGLLIFAGLFDLVVVLRGYQKGCDIQWSISRFMQWLPRRAIFFVCVCFYVMGHFWGFMDCPPCQDKDADTANLQPEPGEYGPPVPVMPRGK